LRAVLQQQLDRFGDQEDRTGLLQMTGRVTKRLFDQYGGREALFEQLNKDFVKNRNLLNTPSDQLAQSLVDGSLIEDDLDDIRIQDPEKYDDIIEQRNEIQNNDTLNQSLEGRTSIPDVPKASASQYQTENSLSQEDVDNFLG